MSDRKFILTPIHINGTHELLVICHQEAMLTFHLFCQRRKKKLTELKISPVVEVALFSVTFILKDTESKVNIYLNKGDIQ